MAFVKYTKMDRALGLGFTLTQQARESAVAATVSDLLEQADHDATPSTFFDADTDAASKLLFRVRDDLNEMAKVEAEPKLEGRQMIMILAPSGKGAARPQAATA